MQGLNPRWVCCLLATSLLVLSPWASTEQAAAQGLSGLEEGGATGSTLPAPEERFMWTFDLQARSQPIGLILSNRFFHRATYEGDGGPLYSGTYQQIGLDVNVSPAFLEIGPAVEFRPINLFVYGFGYHALAFWGTLDYPLSFATRDSPYGDNVVDARDADDDPTNDEETGIAHRVFFSQTTQLQVGRIAIRNQLQTFLYFIPAFEGPYIRERLYDQLVADRDFLLSNSAAVLYEAWTGREDAKLLVGAFHEYVFAREARSTRHRLGGVGVWYPTASKGRIQRWRVYLQVGANIEDPNREGAVFGQGGFGFDLHFGEDP